MFMQLTFYDGFLIFNKHIFDWIIDAFFFETVGIHYTIIKASIVRRWTGDGEPPLKQLEGALKVCLQSSVGNGYIIDANQFVIPYIRSYWSNPPRRRRYFMKSILNWHTIYDLLVQIRDGIDVSVRFLLSSAAFLTYADLGLYSSRTSLQTVSKTI